MKNKLLVTAFAMIGTVFAFTSCEKKTDVMSVNTDMVKATLHQPSARGLLQQNDQALTISEYEFLGGVDDNRLAHRTITFGNGVFSPKKVDTLTYQYGVWGDRNTSYSLIVTPSAGEPYTLWFKGNTLVTPEGLVYGGEGTANSARVEKWENTIKSFSNTDWEATFKGDLVLDSVFRDSVRTTFIPPMTFLKDTIKIFTGKMDTLSADTTCYYRFELNHAPATHACTGHYYRKEVRSKYDRETKTSTVLEENEHQYDCTWFFSEVSSDARFVVTLKSTTPGEEGNVLSISKYKVDSNGKAAELLLGGLTYTRPVAVP